MFLEKFKYINIDTNLFNKICDNLNTITPDNTQAAKQSHFDGKMMSLDNVT